MTTPTEPWRDVAWLTAQSRRLEAAKKRRPPDHAHAADMATIAAVRTAKVLGAGWWKRRR